MSHYSLTRFLYPVDEVEYSFITTLIKKTNIDASYYWAFELYYSGLEKRLFDLFRKIYYDFYAELNPKLENYIINKKNKWIIDKDIKHIACIVKNLFIAIPTPTVFLMRQYINAGGYPSHVFSKAEAHGDGYANLLLSITRNRLANITYDINRLVERDGSDKVHSVIIDYFKIKMNGFVENGREKIEKVWNERTIPSLNIQTTEASCHIVTDVHLLFAITVHLMTDENKINTRSVFGTPSQQNIDDILENETGVVENKYRTLCLKRKWQTDATIGSFHLSRYEMLDTFIKENWFHWEYYAARVPLWRSRIADYSGEVRDEKKELVFEDESKSEQFNADFGYELDEQPKEVQDLSLHIIKSTTWDIWFYNVFGVISQQNTADINGLIDNFGKLMISNTDISNVSLDIMSMIQRMPSGYKIKY